MQSGREVASDLDEAPAHRSPTVVFLMLWFSTGAFPVVLRWSSPEVNADYNDAMYLNSFYGNTQLVLDVHIMPDLGCYVT